MSKNTIDIELDGYFTDFKVTAGELIIKHSTLTYMKIKMTDELLCELHKELYNNLVERKLITTQYTKFNRE